MPDKKEIVTCSVCETQVVAETPHCSGCGYEFSTGKKGVGPFSFVFSEVQDAYQPSGHINTISLPLILILGIVMEIIAGGAVAFIPHAILNESLSLFGLVGLSPRWLMTVLAWGISLIATIVSQLIVLGIFGQVIIGGRNNNHRIVDALGMIIGLTSCMAYLAVRKSYLSLEILDSASTVIGVGFHLFVMIGMTMRFSRVLRRERFCPSCKRYMEDSLRFFTLIRDESTLMELLHARRPETFEKMSALDEEYRKRIRDVKNCSVVNIWWCDHCKEHGYVNVTTQQFRSRRLNRRKHKARLIFSSVLERDEIQTLSSLVETYENFDTERHTLCLQEQVHKRHGHVEGGGMLSSPTLVFPHNGYEIRLYALQTRGLYTYVKTALHLPRNVRLEVVQRYPRERLQPDSIPQKFHKALTRMHPIFLGSAEFDTVFSIRGTDESFAQSILTSDVQQKLLSLERRSVRLLISQEQLRVVVSGFPGGMAEYDVLIDIALLCLEQVKS